MKLVILKSNLKNGLDVVGHAIGTNLNLPILGSVLIKATGSQIQISATNLELAITKNVFGKVVEDGSVAVPYSTLASIVNNVTNERIHLERTKQGNLELKTDNYTANIQSIDPKEFPIIPTVDKKGGGVEIESVVLKDALARVVVACEESDLRPEIAGVRVLLDQSSLKLAATDSFRLAEARILGKQVKTKGLKELEATIPVKASQETIRALGEDEKTTIYIEKNQILIETETTSIISRLVEGNFPDYKSIVPKEIDTEIVVKKDELISALKLASSFASKSNDIKIRVKDKKIIEVYSSDNAVGENNYLIPAKIDGPGTEAMFNWKYLLDGVRAIVGKDVFLGLSANDRPALVKDPGDDSYFYILMPIKAS